MRLTGWYIDGFGIFHDAAMDSLNPGLTVILGDNEAGKSTLLAFVRGVLFGYPDRRSRDPICEPLAGGRHGGRLMLADRALGDGLILERYAGPRGGDPVLTAADGRSLPPGAAEMLLGGITREVFRTIYAFSLSELQTLDSLRDDAVVGALYAAGAGTGVAALPAAEQYLAGRRDALFLPRAQKPALNAQLRELEGIREELRKARDEADAYSALAEELREKEDTLTRERLLLAKLSASRNRVDRLLSAWPRRQQLNLARSSLRSLPDDGVPFPPDGLKRFEEAARDVRRLKEETAALAEREAADRKSAAELPVLEALLEAGPTVRKLATELPEHLRRLERERELPAKIRALDESVTAALQTLAPDLTPERLAGMDLSIASRDRLSDLNTRIVRATTRVVALRDGEQAAREAADEAGRAEAEARTEAEQAARAFGRLPVAALREWRTRCEEAKAATPELERLEADMRDEEQAVREIVQRLSPEWPDRDPAALPDPDVLRAAAADLNGRRRAAATAAEGHAATVAALKSDCERLRERAELRRREAEAAPGAFPGGEEEIREKRKLLADYRAARLMADAGARTAFVGSLAPRLLAAGAALTVCGITVGLISPLPAVLRIAGAAAAGAGILALAAGFALRTFLNSGADATSAEGRLAELAAALGGKDGPFDADTIERELGAAETACRRQAALVEEAVRIEADIRAVDARLAQAETALSRAREECDDAESRRLRLCDEWGLPADRWPAEALGSVASALEEARRRRSGLERLRARREALRGALADLASRAETLPGFVPPSEAGGTALHGRIAACLDEIAGEHAAAAEARARAENSRLLAAESRRRARKEAEALEVAVKEAAELNERFAGVLRDSGLPETLSPETAPIAIDRLSEAAAALAAKGCLEAELREARSALTAFRERVFGVCREIGETPEAGADAEALAASLPDRLADSATNRTLRAEKTATAERTARERGLKEAALQERLEELDGLLRAAGAADEEAFRAKARDHAAREDLRRQESEALSAVVTVVEESDEAVLDDLFRGADRESLERELGMRGQEVAECQARVEALNAEKGTLRARLDRLASADDVAVLRQQEEGLLAEMNENAREWSRLTLALALLNEAKSVHERERQPEVVRRASGYFRTMTGGRYTQVLAPLGERTPKVITRDGATRSPEELSRGTAEQLYLALRFGYICAHAAGGASLPVVMDDILVNFDPDRAQAAAESIAELALRHQILYFTCHPGVAELLRQAGAEADVVTLRRASFTRRPRECAREDNSCPTQGNP